MFQLENWTAGKASSTPYRRNHTPASSRPMFFVNLIIPTTPFGKKVSRTRVRLERETLLRPQITEQTLDVAGRVEQLADPQQHGAAPRVGGGQGLELGEPAGEILDQSLAPAPELPLQGIEFVRGTGALLAQFLDLHA